MTKNHKCSRFPDSPEWSCIESTNCQGAWCEGCKTAAGVRTAPMVPIKK